MHLRREWIETITLLAAALALRPCWGQTKEAAGGKKPNVIFVLFDDLGCGQAAACAAEPQKPNFIIMRIDDMGYGDIGPYGSKVDRTPQLDRMAADGMKLTSFYAAPVCTPSRAQMMTGCYAKRVSLPNVFFPACPSASAPRSTPWPICSSSRATRRCASASGTWAKG